MWNINHTPSIIWNLKAYQSISSTSSSDWGSSYQDDMSLPQYDLSLDMYGNISITISFDE